MTGKKEGKFLTFYLDDGSTIRYDLSTGEQIGVKGKPVKSVAYKTKRCPEALIPETSRLLLFPFVDNRSLL